MPFGLLLSPSPPSALVRCRLVFFAFFLVLLTSQEKTKLNMTNRGKKNRLHLLGHSGPGSSGSLFSNLLLILGLALLSLNGNYAGFRPTFNSSNKQKTCPVSNDLPPRLSCDLSYVGIKL